MMRGMPILLALVIGASSTSAFMVEATDVEEPIITFTPNTDGFGGQTFTVTLTVTCDEIQYYGDPTKETVRFDLEFDLADDLSVQPGQSILLDRTGCLSPIPAPLVNTSTHIMTGGSYAPAVMDLVNFVDAVPAEQSSTPSPVETIPSSDGPAEFTATVVYGEELDGKVGEPVAYAKNTRFALEDAIDAGEPIRSIEIPIRVGGWTNANTLLSWTVVEGSSELIRPIDTIVRPSTPDRPTSIEQTHAVLSLHDISHDETFQWTLEAHIRPIALSDAPTSDRRLQHPLQLIISLDPDVVRPLVDQYEKETGPRLIPAPGVALLVLGLGALAAARRHTDPYS